MQINTQKMPLWLVILGCLFWPIMLYWAIKYSEWLPSDGYYSYLDRWCYIVAIFIPGGTFMISQMVHENLNTIRTQAGLECIDNKMLWSVLSFFIAPLAIVLMQMEINKTIDAINGGAV